MVASLFLSPMFSTSVHASLRIAGLFVVLLGACAGTSPSRQDELDRAFARIQVHEATIERQHMTLTSGDAPCPERCDAARRTCAAQTNICALATNVADADALTRCERAKARCHTARAQSSRACACDGAKR